MKDWIQLTKEGCILSCYAQPKAAKSEITGLHGIPPRLKIRLAAKPIEGEANLELIRFLADLLHIAKSRLHLIRGEQSRQKDVLVISDLSEVTVRSIIDSAIGGNLEKK